MALIRKTASLGSAIALAAVLFGALAGSAGAQATPPFRAYGTDQTPGDVVTAWVDGEQCAAATVDADGNWVMNVPDGDTCVPVEGDIIEFQVNGETCDATAVYQSGGAPADVANGIDLGTCEAAAATPTASPTAVVPGPSPTGNAGLLGSTGTSVALVLALGVFAAAMIAGGRAATRRS